MAGTARNGSSSIAADLGFDVLAPFTGNARGGGLPWKQWTNGSGGRPDPHDPFIFALATGGVATATGGGAVKPAPTERDGADEADRTSFGADWFEHVHILPRAKIEFGNIITLVDEEYEIYSAFRRASVDLNTITNNALPGVNLPDLTAPVTLPPLTSLLDPSSTTQTASALGTLVKLKVEALANGLPIFDTSIDFDFGSPSNDVQLFVSGSRIVLLPFKYEFPFSETLSFYTDITPSISGKEQRASPRKNPRQILAPFFLLDGNQRRHFQAMLFDWSANIFGLPLWNEALTLRTAVSVGATSYQVEGADDVDLRVGGLAAIITDDRTFDVINISAVSDTLISASDPSLNAYPAGTEIMPLRPCILLDPVGTRRPPVKLEGFQLRLLVTDNDTGLMAGDTTPGFWSLRADGRVLFDDCNFMDGEAVGSLQRRVFRFDNVVGGVYQISPWDRGKREQSKVFVLRSRAEIKQLRRCMLALRGRQKAFWTLSFIEDLEPAAAIVAATDTLDIVAIDYELFVKDREPMNEFRIHFTDGTSLERTVLSSSTVSSTVERLTLDTTWPANRSIDEVERIEFFDLSRFDADDIRFIHERADLARVHVPVVRVFDDI